MQKIKPLNEEIRIQKLEGTAKNSTAHDMAHELVPKDVLDCFRHLPNLKRVEPYADGFSICTFESKINFK